MTYAIRLHTPNAGNVGTISATFETDRAWRRPPAESRSNAILSVKWFIMNDNYLRQ